MPSTASHSARTQSLGRPAWHRRSACIARARSGHTHTRRRRRRCVRGYCKSVRRERRGGLTVWGQVVDDKAGARPSMSATGKSGAGTAGVCPTPVTKQRSNWDIDEKHQRIGARPHLLPPAQRAATHEDAGGACGVGSHGGDDGGVLGGGWACVCVWGDTVVNANHHPSSHQDLSIPASYRSVGDPSRHGRSSYRVAQNQRAVIHHGVNVCVCVEGRNDSSGRVLSYTGRTTHKVT